MLSSSLVGTRECGAGATLPPPSIHTKPARTPAPPPTPMAGSSKDGRRRCPTDLRDDDEPEEGELVSGCDSDVNTEDYYNNHYYSSSDDTDETTSDCNARPVVPPTYGRSSAAPAASNGNGKPASSSPPFAVPAAVLACPVCGKEFRSRKAVCGHMKVHQHRTIGRHEQQQVIVKHREIKRNAAAVTGGWGGTGKRGCSGCWSKPASPSAQSDQSMGAGTANPNVVLRPMPLAFAAPNPLPERMECATPNQSSVPMASGTPNQSSGPIASTMTNVSDESSSGKTMMHSDATETVVAGSSNPPTQAVVHLADAAPAPPSPPPAEVHATSVHQQPIAPPPPADAEEERVQVPPVHPHPIAPRLPGRQNPDGYRCNKCGAWFSTHQGLGGHQAGHKNRELAAVACRRDAKPKKVHSCKHCGAEFPTGQELGGHMRKHYKGPKITPKKKQRLVVQPLPPPAEQRTLEPAPRSAVPGRVLLFGVDIGARAPTPAAQEEGSSSATQDPSVSTAGEQ